MKIYTITGMPDEDVLRAAAACVGGGGTLIFPTDTVYGIGCAPDDERAVESIFAAKGRAADKPLAIHLARPDDAQQFAQSLTPGARAIVSRLWPGPVAIIVERREGKAAAAARRGATISLRCPDDAVCCAILLRTGPLAATSANLSGSPAFAGDVEQLDALPTASMAIIAGPTSLRRESTVLDCSGPAVRIVRAGAIEAADIERALAGAASLVR